MINRVKIKTDFRFSAVVLTFFLPQVFASPMSEMDKLVPLVYQYPSQAGKKIEALNTDDFTFREKLRLQLIKCELLNQNGDGQAAINLAQLAIAQAKSNQLDEALPYFYICMADGYSFSGEYEHTFKLLDDAILNAKQFNQPQALVTALRNRAQFDTVFEDLTTAFEDLRFAIDIYPQQFSQKYNWFWSPQAYVYVAMANLLYSSDEFASSFKYIKTALETGDAIGNVRHNILLSSARISFDAKEKEKSKAFLRQAKETVSEAAAPLDLAYGFAVIASLELDFGNLTEAESYLHKARKIFNEHYKIAHIFRANRLSARIKFAQGKDKEALKLMKTAIKQGIQLQRHTDLKSLYHILENYYAKQGDPEKAYQNLKLAYEAGNKANKELNSARFIQYKARLDQQAAIHSKQKLSDADKPQTGIKKHNVYKLLIFIFFMLGICIFFVVFQSRRQVKKQRELARQTLPINEALNQILLSAKKQASPLAILLADVSELESGRLKDLRHGIDDVIRETDIVSRFSASELVVLLPNTTNAGALKVMAHLHRHLKQVTTEDHIFGMASMHQFDQIEQLIKRANFDRLTQMKNRQLRTTRFENIKAS